MRYWRHFQSALWVVALVVGAAAAMAEQQPKLMPTRDVDIRYDVTRPQEPKVRERVRWLASEHLERVDATGRSTSIFDRDAHAVTFLRRPPAHSSN